MKALKRVRSASSMNLRPKGAQKKVPINDFHEFSKDVTDAVNRMLPTNGRRYEQAAILVITFSVTDIPQVASPRDELLKILKDTYNWQVVRHEVDCTLYWRTALNNLGETVGNFINTYGSRASEECLLTYCFSGHGFEQDNELQLYGSYNGQRPNAPFIPWNKVLYMTSMGRISDKNHQLCIMDCCAAGLANLGEDIEVLGACDWESKAPTVPQASFTRALIDELNKAKGQSITTTQLVSHLYSHETVQLNRSMPVHKRPPETRTPALIHSIEKTPTPLPQVKIVPRFRTISMTLKKGDTLPNATQWAEWLKSNLPPYAEDIDIMGKWKTGSYLVLVVLPIEIWLDLEDRSAYGFVGYNHTFAGKAARLAKEAI